ncbi:MAG: 50S ribosomal protein L28 [bacterium]|nr:50S ribosomal protein L28 [Candidatus Margulisiibacteriota bacterium]
MSKKCFACGKKPKTGNTVSHSMNHTGRKWYPNLQSVNILVFDKKKKKDKKSKEYVCTKCLKSGKIQKAI